MDCDKGMTEAADTNIPSCESCRKRKLKCTRQQPTCSNCNKFDVACIYDLERKKPGFKVGVVENLSRRLEIIEKNLSINEERQKAPITSTSEDTLFDGPGNTDAQPQSLVPVVGVLSSLAKELHNLTSAIRLTHQHIQNDESDDSNPKYSRKRKRGEPHLIDLSGRLGFHTPNLSDREEDVLQHHPEGAANLLDAIIDAYFRFVHPWISVLHEPSFRAYYRNKSKGWNHKTVINAMTVAALRFVRVDGIGLSTELLADETSKARQKTLLTALDSTTVENTQALLILTFSEISDDNFQKAFSLLGVIVRNVELLQITREGVPQRNYSGVFGATLKTSTPDEWIEEEEKRRLLWNTFMLDRLFVALSACKPGLAGSSISRKLPACGSFWYTNQPCTTPYLCLSDDSTGGLHCSLAPKQSSTEMESHDGQNAHDAEHIGKSAIGSLAFYVETVESMSMVMSHFLSQPVDFGNRNHISRWLTRFKELDLYLTCWKMGLPQQWADSGMSRRTMPGIMDPAMIAANSTHNTCLIILHEQIAYPDAKLQWVQLPSLCSAKVCVDAAIEICTMITKFLEQRGESYPLPPQLGLCAFVSARSLLMHWRYYTAPLAQEFWLLLSVLDDMARRWERIKSDQGGPSSIFSRFSDLLRTIHHKCELDPTYRHTKMEPLYANEFAVCRSQSRHWISPETLVACLDHARSELNVRPPEQSQPVSRFSNVHLMQGSDTTTAQYGGLGRISRQSSISSPVSPSDPNVGDSLLATVETLLDPSFTSADRVVSFDDLISNGMSEAPMSWDFAQDSWP